MTSRSAHDRFKTTTTPEQPAQPQSSSDEDDSCNSTPTAAVPSRSPYAEARSQDRPQLVRLPPGRLSEIAQTSPSNDAELARTDDVADYGAAPSTGGHGDTSRRPSGGARVASSEAERLANLKDAVNAKLLLQQRKRPSYGTTANNAGQKRVLPIAEEEGHNMLPSLAAAFASPMESSRPLSSTSTESADSGRTARASVPSTPAERRPLRTPSYPFPVVPGSSRVFSSPLHQPFAVLSSTGADDLADARRESTPGGNSAVSMTPAGTTTNFLPPGATFQEMEDPRFPTPNLYDMVLQLNTEPGIEQWWTTVTNLMHDHFSAERVTLIVPLDATDIENVPWGQKATFNMSGREEFVSHRMVLEQQMLALKVERPDFGSRDLSSTDTIRDTQMQKLHPERLRPRLESRHSYAGHGRDMKESIADPQARAGARPVGLQRTMTHASGIPGGVGPGRIPARRLASTSTLKNDSLSDPDFSSIAGGVDAGPYAEVFPNLRSLDHEAHSLIEPGGVNRVLERGRVVTVTRDYTSDDPLSYGKPTATGKGGGTGNSEIRPKESGKSTAERMFGNYRSAALASENYPSMNRDYEEYEQYPASPWAQSPAPSPAIQSDEESNPFFTSDAEPHAVEDAFDPTNTPKDYSQYGQVEAIGVDRASTVIHIPLVHPALSQPMQSLRMYDRNEGHSGAPQRSNTVDMERKAPIAVISILSAAVPYPQNLLKSIKLLGPHLATSFATAQQFSATHHQSLSIRQRVTASGHQVLTAPMTIEPTSLNGIVHSQLEEPSESASGSMTSPSDYSGRSRHSPSGSIIGTPGWDPAAHGWTSSRSAVGTPYTGSEMVDNYFDAKKRSGQRSASNASTQMPVITPARPVKKPPSSEGKSSITKSPQFGEDDARSRLSSQRSTRSTREETFARDSSPLPGFSSQRPGLRHVQSHVIADMTANKKHSLLHSYGADLDYSFSTDVSTPGFNGHTRKNSCPEDMPPPSERLLRTIIDSVPVQIFTATPDTGHLSWVNSKFLIYRGQEPRQVLNEPWEAIHPDDRAEFVASWNRSLRTAQQLQQKVQLKRFDGAFRWFYVRAAPLKDRRQKIVHWIGTMMDFHEQHLAEMNSARQQETEASEAKYRALANSSPQIVFAVSRARGVTFCNSQWIHYSGQTEAHALGAGFMSYVHPEDLVKCRLPTFDDTSQQPTNVPTSVPYEPRRTLSASATSSSASLETEKADQTSSPILQMPQRKLSELATTGILKVTRDADGRPSYSTEVRLRSKEGEFRWHLVRVLISEPTVTGSTEETWYGTCTDINDHKTLERDLKETMDEKSRFLSNMSHEIRTPLNGITGMVNFLIDSSLTSEQMEHVNIIRASTEGLRGLINDILDLSKAEAGMIQLSMDWLYVRALLEEVNDLTSAMAIDKGLELNYLVEESVPTQVKGDRFRLRQILLNIIGNAIKFTQSGEVFVRCSTIASDQDMTNEEIYIQFDIIDTGVGFTEREAEYLFKRFSQIDGSSTRQHGGTGLGLVISRQLAQLHGGDMGAKGIPGKGSTFTFYVKASLPSTQDQPPVPPPTPGIGLPNIPILPGIATTSGSGPKLTKLPSLPMQLKNQPRPSPKFLQEQTQTPSPFLSPDRPQDSPSASSASSSSVPSLRSEARTNSIRSERSSVSSFVPENVFSNKPMDLSIPSDRRSSRTDDDYNSMGSGKSVETVKPQVSALEPVPASSPPMYSILVVCPLKYSREATVQHIDMTLPKNIPHQITARDHLLECQKILGGDSPVIFTHIIVVLQDVGEITALMDQVFSSLAHQTTTIVIITDLAQRRRIMETAPRHNYEQLGNERRLRFVFKPLKPSRFAIIFDPQKEREMSTDRNQDSAQQVAFNQKQVFEELARRLGNKDKRVLLVEDNKVNQMVVLKFLAKVSIKVETAMDGVQCTDKVFAQPHGYYSIILCDLHMPNKDGYQTCKEIRKWERHSRYTHLPIIALSANVLGDVYQKCVDAGFNSYITKPVDFKELSTVLMTFMDPRDPTKPHEFMKLKRGHVGSVR